MSNGPNNSWVYFENALLAASVRSEVDNLSRDGLVVTLTHIKHVYEGTIDPYRLQTWHDYQGIRLYLVEYDGELMVYAVEIEFQSGGQRTLKISIMFAGVRENGYVGFDGEWDGSDQSLWRDIVEPRCRYHFG